MRAIDTNLLVRLLVRDDDEQVAAAERYASAGVWVSHLALAEATWVLVSVYGVSHARLAAAVELILDHEVLVLQEPGVVAAALAVYRDQPKLSFSDCLLLEIARKAGHLPFGTFDRGLAAQPGAEKVELADPALLPDARADSPAGPGHRTRSRSTRNPE